MQTARGHPGIFIFARPPGKNRGLGKGLKNPVISLEKRIFTLPLRPQTKEFFFTHWIWEWAPEVHVNTKKLKQHGKRNYRLCQVAG